MGRVHPNDNLPSAHVAIDEQYCSPASTVLTVWKKSLVFNCNGFTVYDSTGNLVFRVDNYASNMNDEVILMDAAGNALLTMRRKNTWKAYMGDNLKENKTLFKVRRCGPFQSNHRLARVLVGSSQHSDFHIEGSYSKRSCTVYTHSGSIVAEVKRKQATSDVMLGDDVFSLVVEPCYDQAFVMGLIVILDQMLS